MKLILDRSKWRCGGFGPNKLGEGFTALLNREGFSCCLGQFSPQLNNFVATSIMLDKSTPGSVEFEIPLLNEKEVVCGLGIIKDTELSKQAMAINDDLTTTPEEKIEALRAIFPYEIEVINA